MSPFLKGCVSNELPFFPVQTAVYTVRADPVLGSESNCARAELGLMS